MKDFQQSDNGGIAKSQLMTLLWFLWIWYTSRKSRSNTEVGLQIILAEWIKVWSFFKQCLAILLGFVSFLYAIHLNIYWHSKRWFFSHYHLRQSSSHFTAILYLYFYLFIFFSYFFFSKPFFPMLFLFWMVNSNLC